MQRTKRTIPGLVLLAAIGLGVSAWISSTTDVPAAGKGAEAAAAAPSPVDDDLHHFMEYVFEPNYKRLQPAMAEKPVDKKAWKAIKGDALTLAECANLLLLREPAEKADAWRKLSVAVRTHGGELYQAARESDYPAARKAYVTMLNQCNACHQQFADGKHQLQP